MGFQGDQEASKCEVREADDTFIVSVLGATYCVFEWGVPAMASLIITSSPMNCIISILSFIDIA